jgi:hypothetical protein
MRRTHDLLNGLKDGLKSFRGKIEITLEEVQGDLFGVPNMVAISSHNERGSPISYQ